MTRAVYRVGQAGFALAAAAITGDLVSTWVALRHGAREGSPGPAWVIDHLGIGAGVVLSGVVAFGMLGVLARLFESHRRDEPTVWFVALAVVAFAVLRVLVVVHNVSVA